MGGTNWKNFSATLHKKGVQKMIDTIKFYTMINKETYNKIYNNSILKTSYNKKDRGNILWNRQRQARRFL